ncbi:MAG: hypothetical protein Q8R82_17945 [Hyphomonadaceae bacterium]|nr:hypothetical protein [Hyphomonadaceae bacterium]
MEWYWWLLIAVVFLLFVVRWVLPVQNHPSHKLGKQGSSMGWYAAGTSKDEKGYQNLRVSKGGMQAVISFANGNVILVHPPVAQPFKDFVELEEFLRKPSKSPPIKAVSPPAPEVDLEKDTDYHAVLDEMAGECIAFIIENELHLDDDWPTELYAEAIVYLACYNAKLGHRHKFSIAGWNTFKSSVENRMLGIRNTASPRDDSNTTSLVSYVSGYHAYLTEREKLARPAHEASFELADRILEDVGGSASARDKWRAYFRQLIVRGSKDVLFKVWLCFER